jgi:hypothetical protein
MIRRKAPSWGFMDSPLSESRALIDGDDMIPDPPPKIGTQVRAVSCRVDEPSGCAAAH